jgi:hypothetical protein
VIEKTTEASTTKEIFGVARSTRRGEEWEIRLDLESRPWRSAGDPLSDFGTQYVIAGSSEEAELIEQVNAEWRAEQQRQSEEEPRRLAEMQRFNDVKQGSSSMEFANLVAKDDGAFVAAAVKLQAPGRNAERFGVNLYCDGVM